MGISADTATLGQASEVHSGLAELMVPHSLPPIYHINSQLDFVLKL